MFNTSLFTSEALQFTHSSIFRSNQFHSSSPRHGSEENHSKCTGVHGRIQNFSDGGGGRATPKSMRPKHIIWPNSKKLSLEFLLKQKKIRQRFLIDIQHEHSWSSAAQQDEITAEPSKTHTQQVFTVPQIKTLHSPCFSQRMFPPTWTSNIRISRMTHHAMLWHVGSLLHNLL